MRNIFAIVVFFGLLCLGVNVASQNAHAAPPQNTAATTTQPPKAVADVTDKPAKLLTPDEKKKKPIGEIWASFEGHDDLKAAAIGCIAGMAFLTLVIFVLSAKTEILRGNVPTDFGGYRNEKTRKKPQRPFSLAQCQMAWWFILVFGCYIFIYLTTGDYGSITTQVLTLMGIGTGTALGAAMIDQTKATPKQDAFAAAVATIRKYQPQMDALEQAAAGAAAAAGILANPNATPAQRTAATAQKTQADADTTAASAAIGALPELVTALKVRDEFAPQLASEDFFKDILTDVNGISLHRFQSMVWTLVLGGVLVIEVAVRQAFPTFNAETLALLGIASGVYLGFKVPEQSA